LKRRRKTAGRRRYSRRRFWIASLIIIVAVVSGLIVIHTRSKRGTVGGMGSQPASTSPITTNTRTYNGPYFWVLLPRDKGLSVVMNLTKMHLDGYVFSNVERMVYSILTTPHFLAMGSDNKTMYSAFLLDLRSLEILRLYLNSLGIQVEASMTNTTNASIEDLASTLASGNMNISWIVVRSRGVDAGTLVAKADEAGLKCMLRGEDILVAPSDLSSLSELASSLGAEIIGVYDQYPSLIYQPA